MKIGIVGLGLIGGSLAKAIKKKYRLYLFRDRYKQNYCSRGAVAGGY